MLGRACDFVFISGILGKAVQGGVLISWLTVSENSVFLESGEDSGIQTAFLTSRGIAVRKEETHQATSGSANIEKLSICKIHLVVSSVLGSDSVVASLDARSS